MHAGGSRRLLDLGGRNSTRGPRLGREHPQHAVAVEIGLRVHEQVGQVVHVTVVVAPPDECGIDHVLVILTNELGVGLGLRRPAELLIDIIVVPELLNGEARGEAECPARCARHYRLLPSWAYAPSRPCRAVRPSPPHEGRHAQAHTRLRLWRIRAARGGARPSSSRRCFTSHVKWDFLPVRRRPRPLGGPRFRTVSQERFPMVRPVPGPSPPVHRPPSTRTAQTRGKRNP